MKSRRPQPGSSFLQFEEQYVFPRVGRTLIVGSQVYAGKEDRRLRYADAVGVDILDGPGVDRILNMEDELPRDLGMFDHVECLSVLEHCQKPWLVAANIESVMNPEATLFVSVPFCWRVHAYPDDHFRISASGIRSIFPNIKWEKLLYAELELTSEDDKISMYKVNEFPYIARTETVGFGTR